MCKRYGRMHDVVEVAGVVLAAGEGRRLRPLTEERPKPLCPVGARTLLDHALDRVRPHVGAIAVNAHHLVEQLAAYVGEHHPDLHLSVEQPVALGTAGALGGLRDWIDGRAVLVVNADAWTSAPLDPLLAGWDGVAPRLLCSRHGRHDFGDRHYVGAALLPWSDVAQLRAEASGLYEVSWRQAYADGRLDLVTDEEGRYVDCGTPLDYLRANLLSSGGCSVVGEGAVVEGRLVRSVVWPGARVAADEVLVDSIRTTRGRTVHVPFATPEGE